MYKIQTLNNISAAGLDRLPRDRYEVGSEVQQPDAILVRSHNMHGMEIPESLKAVGRAGAGVNNIPVTELSKKGIAVFNAPGANANAVKELVITGMLLGARNICQSWQFARGLSGNDDAIHKDVELGKKRFVGFELPGRTLGVIGLGAIGVQVANAALALGMKVIGYDPEITVQRAWQMSSDVQQAADLNDLLAKSDFVTFHVPLMDATKHMIDAEHLRLMKDGAVILNFSRVGIINDEDVIKAIESGKIYSYICDFPSNLLKDHPRVITLPHIGASTKEAEENCAIMVAEQIRDILENGNVSNSVNFPDINMPHNGGHRVVVVNANVPNMLGQISTALANSRHNIIDMLNKSRAELAYTLVDVENKLTDDCIKAIASIDGVLSVRMLANHDG